MRIPAARTQTDLTENMMTSMIDVVFLLLIFFLVAAAGRRSEAVLPADLGPGNLGESAAGATAPGEEVWIRAATDPAGHTTWTLNDTTYNSAAEIKAILTQLADLQADMPVILDIGGEVPAGDLVEVYDACRAAGLTAVNFNLAKPADE